MTFQGTTENIFENHQQSKVSRIIVCMYRMSTIDYNDFLR